MVPKSIFEAFSTNEILQIVVFSVIFGIALGAYGEKGQMVTDFLDKIAHVVLIMVNYVMWFAPLGVLGSRCSSRCKIWFRNIYPLCTLFTGVCFGYCNAMGGITWSRLSGIRKEIKRLIKTYKTPLLIAFTTTSSEAVFQNL